jgi:hypothetical protein
MRAVVMLAVLGATAAGAADVEASASEAVERKTFVGLSVLSGFSSRAGLGVEAERALSERVSVRLGVRVGTNLFSQDNQDNVSRTRDFALGASPGVRFYLTGRAPSGLWVGPSLELNHSRSTFAFPSVTVEGATFDVESRQRQWSVGAAGLVGYSMVLREGLTVQAGVGLGVTRGWQHNASTGVLVGLEGGKRAQQLQAPVASATRSTSWAFGERVSFAVGWAF